jgi:hypothetical protein
MKLLSEKRGELAALVCRLPAGLVVVAVSVWAAFAGT